MGKISKREFIRMSAFGTAALCCPHFMQAAPDVRKPGKYSRLAIHYSETARGVQCGICPNECTLKPGEVSTCHNRVNIDNKLYSVAYGNPCAVHVDPIEKKPLLHFLPQSRIFSIATAGCNFACLNCQNWEISQTSPDKTRNVELMPASLAENCRRNQCASVAYTYSEPISWYEYMFDCAKAVKEQNIRNVMVSNGYINPDPLRQLLPYLDAANIDLKAFDPGIHLKLTGGKLQPVLDTLLTLQKSRVWLEITHLIVPSWNDDMGMIRKMCQWLSASGFSGVPLHFSRFSPLYKLTQLPATPLSTLIRARDIARQEGLKFVYIGNVPGRGYENSVCPVCDKTIIEREGFSILSNHLENGACGFCKAAIPGVWS